MALVVVERRRVSILGARALDLESLSVERHLSLQVSLGLKPYESDLGAYSAPIEFDTRSESLIVQAALCGVHASVAARVRASAAPTLRPSPKL